jgi:MarR family transcriptional regulator, organic hydroperoxide resistance regulator
MLKSKSKTTLSMTATQTFARQIMRGGLGQMSIEMQSLELTFAQIGTLMALDTQGTMSVSEVAERTNLSLAAASHLVNRLVIRDLVERRENAVDRRQKDITLSKEGKAFLQRFDAAREKILTGMLEPLDPDLLERLEAVLTEVLHHNAIAIGGFAARGGK